MAHGYPDGKYRGGKSDRKKSDSGPGKNAQHGSGENHSQKTKKGGGATGTGGPKRK
jgi:hypothetical protein